MDGMHPTTAWLLLQAVLLWPWLAALGLLVWVVLIVVVGGSGDRASNKARVATRAPAGGEDPEPSEDRECW